MKICIDATPIGIHTPDRGGVYRYIFELIGSLRSVDRKNGYTLFFNFLRSGHIPAMNEAVSRLAGDNFKVKLSRFPPGLRDIVNPPVELLAGRFDVFHGCFDRLPRIRYGKGVVTVHDLRYLEDMELDTPSGWVETLKKASPTPEIDIKDCVARERLMKDLRSTIGETVERADAIITVSDFCKRRLTELLGVRPSKVSVVYHGANSHFAPRPEAMVRRTLEAYGIKRPYILYTGKFDPAKNLSRLMESFGRVRSERDAMLVMAGPKNWFQRVLAHEAEKLGLSGKVVFTGFVSDEELSCLYSGASVFAFPSLYEGFGIPLLEAMACRVPVVTGRLCSIPEVAGDAALYVDPFSADSIARGILRCMEDEGLRHELAEKGFSRVKAFTWERTARQTLKVYEGVYEGVSG